MNLILSILVAITSLSSVCSYPLEKRANPKGIDVSSNQGPVNWSKVKSNGISFAYVKATEGTSYTNPDFAQQYVGAYDQKIIRGAYHFARPGSSSGAAQAKYFTDHGGKWSADGLTLPGAVDLEAGCSGLSHAAMVSWIKSFSDEYHSITKRYPVIYTTTSWWQECTGNTKEFASTSPLWLAHWASSAGTLPAGWTFYTFWQYADSGPNPGDQDVFNGSLTQLKK
ncbi:glycoside hydrolase family 25 protein [Sistotremastrum niveocremeum HHB9708]|uniref:Lysozyme n=1 Tax=Sistotremastrum niveocremeum HHB9708 TaxID=1314777 RepID=A0A164XWV3_9AGAM|nr:glycoside hydrolase family 25 protein [Sistotremastrum niveocremeum HHB9708]